MGGVSRSEACRGGRRAGEGGLEGEVVVGGVFVGVGGSGVANGAPVSHEDIAESASAPADGIGEREDGPLFAGCVEVVDEGHVLGHEGTGGDVERVLEQNDGSELGRVDEVWHGRRGRGRR
jgi:hypothetical protein